MQTHRGAISALDLGAYMLANFGSVAEVRAALDPATFSVVNFWMPPRALQVVRSAGLVGDGGFATVHFAVHDARHDSLVIEFTGTPTCDSCHMQMVQAPCQAARALSIRPACCAGTDGSYTHVLRENPLGVMTNEPQLPAHCAQYERWAAARRMQHNNLCPLRKGGLMRGWLRQVHAGALRCPAAALHPLQEWHLG